MEELLRFHRDQALRILKENRGQSREGIELLVRGRLSAIASAALPQGTTPTREGIEALYREVLDLSYAMFSLGYTMAHTLQKEPVAR
ncbi:MAG TPA: hypothetical protein VIL07_11915 [Symbiobacteriaceae bacterium]